MLSRRRNRAADEANADERRDYQSNGEEDQYGDEYCAARTTASLGVLKPIGTLQGPGNGVATRLRLDLLSTLLSTFASHAAILSQTDGPDVGVVIAARPR